MRSNILTCVLLFLLLPLCIAASAAQPSAGPASPYVDGNFTVTETMLNYAGTRFVTSVRLFDGFGRPTATSAGHSYGCHYYIRDHQGNNRVVVSDGGVMEQTTHYYPYGGLMYLSTEHGFQKYKYNAKELDRTHGLDWYDYEARQYDPVIARFTSMDPLCEKYYNISPYAYCAGNPVNIVDPDGRDGVRIIDDANKSITIKATYFVRTGEKPFRCGNKICTLSGYSNKDIENMNHMPSKDKFQSVNVCF